MPQTRETTEEMMKKPHNYSFFAILLFIVISSSGCIQHSIPIYYYTLNSKTDTKRTITTPLPPVFLGPIQLASFLDQGQIITRNSKNSINIEEQLRWAGDLKQMISDVMLSNIENRLGTHSVFKFSGTDNPSGLQITVTFLHFEKDNDGNAHVMARWSIRSIKNGTILHSSTSNFKTIPDSDSTEALTIALSQGLDLLTKDFSETILTLISQ